MYATLLLQEKRVYGHFLKMQEKYDKHVIRSKGGDKQFYQA
jgi:hypothetical protein